MRNKIHMLLDIVNALLTGIALGGVARLGALMYPRMSRDDYIILLVIVWLGLCSLADAMHVYPVYIVIAGVGIGAGLLLGDYVVQCRDDYAGHP